ncbi:unnamed protein product, partial [Ascophyllum nodosum]
WECSWITRQCTTGAYSRLITCGRNSSRVCNARSMPPSLTRAGFRSPTSWSTLLRRHSVACWSV